MKYMMITCLGFALTSGVSAFAGQDAPDKYKETTKVKEKGGKLKGEQKVKGTDDDGQRYAEKTKVKSKHGKTKVKTETKGTPPADQ